MRAFALELVVEFLDIDSEVEELLFSCLELGAEIVDLSVSFADLQLGDGEELVRRGSGCRSELDLHGLVGGRGPSAGDGGRQRAGDALADLSRVLLDDLA